MEPDTLNIQKLTDQELAKLCLTKKQDEWNEFFRRFTPIFSKTIISTLKSHSARYSDISPDEDVIWDIQEKLVVRFFNGGLLSRCEDLSGIRSWLKRVAENQTRDWLKQSGRLKELPKCHFEESLQSLDATLYKDGDDAVVSLHDFVTTTIDPDGALAVAGAGEYKAYHLERQYVDMVRHLLLPLQRSAKKCDQRGFWIARLICLAPWPMKQSEIDSLAEFSPLPSEETVNNLSRISKDVEHRENGRAVSMGRAVAYWHTIRHYETRCNALRNDDSHQAVKLFEELNQKIAAVELQREEALRIGLKIPRPSNRDIAEIVGLPANQEAQVTVIFKRLREKLAGSMDTFFGMEADFC